MELPNEIIYEGKTLQRIPRTDDSREGDYMMISSELFPVSVYDGDPYVLGGLLTRYMRVVQAAYREKETETLKKQKSCK